MLFGRRDKKKPNERVLDLKARVDALRAADEATREKPYSLDHFLEGDDVLTGRAVADEYTPTGFDPASSGSGGHAEPDNHFEVNLQAELEKYIRRQEELTRVQEEAREPAPPQASASPSEPESFLLDGTWSRDNAFAPVRANPEAPKSPDSDWPSGLDAPPAPPEQAWDPGTSSWPDTRDWPREEQWPPRKDEAV